MHLMLQTVQPSDCSLDTGTPFSRHTCSLSLATKSLGGPLGKHKIKLLLTPVSPSLAGDPGSTASFSHLFSHL